MKTASRKRVVQVGRDDMGRELVRVETFRATGTLFARCIERRHLSDYTAGGYVSSTYLTELEWRAIYREDLVIYMREREYGAVDG